MYSKEEASKIKEQFWITFGKYMKPIPSADGLPINWVNYKTGVKHIFFRMDADGQKAKLTIAITHSDQLSRQLYFEQFEALKTIFCDSMDDEWTWELNAVDNFNNVQAQISKTLHGVSIYKKDDWPALITFLKTGIIAYDRFWVEVKPIFEAL